jgi:hypothetical protein
VASASCPVLETEAQDRDDCTFSIRHFKPGVEKADCAAPIKWRNIAVASAIGRVSWNGLFCPLRPQAATKTEGAEGKRITYRRTH